MPPFVTTTIWPNQVLAVCKSNERTNRGAPVPNVGRPMIDPIISLKLFTLEASHLCVGFGDRGVLRQIPVNDQFVTVG